jgi:hypothetical protein
VVGVGEWGLLWAVAGQAPVPESLAWVPTLQLARSLWAREWLVAGPDQLALLWPSAAVVSSVPV